MSREQKRQPLLSPVTNAMLAGAAAGLAVDVVLFPLDTLKTRLQAPEGFFASGGFRGVYRGLLATASVSAPNAALFFMTYETMKREGRERLGLGVASEGEGGHRSPELELVGLHMAASAVGESAACLLRVPAENVKQRLQAGRFARTRDAVRGILAASGPRGFLGGYLSTLCREIPFVLIQFPLYEQMKRRWAARQGVPHISPVEASVCGGVSGAAAAFLTTPFDVVKTRIMLGADLQGVPYTTVRDTMRRVYKEGGLPKLWSGAVPRVLWLTFGGIVFLGSYEAARDLFGQFTTTAAVTVKDGESDL